MSDDESNEHQVPSGACSPSSEEPAQDDQTQTIRTLKGALELETQTTETLRADLERLREEVARVETSFEERLNDARIRREEAEAKLADQSSRLNALGAGREQTMHELQETRAELARVAADRDRLQKELTVLSGMQTETVALPDERHSPGAAPDVLPTLEELMASWNTFEDATEPGSNSPPGSSVIGDSVARADTSQQEMISPELVFVPEDFRDDATGNDKPGAPADFADIAATHDAAASLDSAAPRRPNSRVLVFHDADPPIKYPLYKEVITIGRSDIADIQVDGDSVSRIHARVTLFDWGALVEDAGSKNGVEVNYEPVLRQELRHGDVLTVGKLRFTFVDTSLPAPAHHDEPAESDRQQP